MNQIKFSVALKSMVPVPGTMELVKKFTGEQVMSDPQVRTLASLLFDGISVYETDLDAATLELAFQAMLGRKVHFIGFFVKSQNPDRFGRRGNEETEYLREGGWMFFGANPKGAASKSMNAVDLTPFLPKK